MTDCHLGVSLTCNTETCTPRNCLRIMSLKFDKSLISLLSFIKYKVIVSEQDAVRFLRQHRNWSFFFCLEGNTFALTESEVFGSS